jgi:hypothetical protein
MFKTTGHPTRRSLLAASAALPLFGILTRPASAAEFNFKMGSRHKAGAEFTLSSTDQELRPKTGCPT